MSDHFYPLYGPKFPQYNPLLIILDRKYKVQHIQRLYEEKHNIS